MTNRDYNPIKLLTHILRQMYDLIMRKTWRALKSPAEKTVETTSFDNTKV